MKNILILALVCILGSTALAQTYTVPNNESFAASSYAQVKASITTPLTLASPKSAIARDILVEGKVDTTLSAGYTFYGRIWSTANLGGLPRIMVTGRDSGTIIVSYRHVSFTTENVGYGPWVTAGSAVIKVPRNGRDTLIAPLNPTYADTAFVNSESGFIQYKYYVVPANAVFTAGTSTTRPKNTVSRTFTTWRGEVDLVFRREGGN